jgi:hypothetical protein
VNLLSTQSDAFDDIINLLYLSVAFFLVSLFLSIRVQVVLRRDDPDERPVGIKAIIVTVYLFVLLGLCEGLLEDLWLYVP